MTIACIAGACGSGDQQARTRESEPAVAVDTAPATALPQPAPTSTTLAVTPTATSLPAPTPTPTSAPASEAPDSDEQAGAPASDCRRLTDFDNVGEWRIVNDGVMGGLSQGQAAVVDGVLGFEGTIVTDGGGFSMVRTPLAPEALADAMRLRFRVRGDGRQYELIADDSQQGTRSSISHFGPIPTEDGAWAEVEVGLDALDVRSFGNPVQADPFRADLAVSIGIILADGVDGPFTLEVDWVDACA